MYQLLIGLTLFLCINVNAAVNAADQNAQVATKAHATTASLVELKTDLGTMVIQLYDKKAPLTVKNFLSLVNEGFYDGVIFHRVIPNFVAQAGGYTFDFQRKPTQATVVNESNNGLDNTQATVAMARTRDPNSASTQFYINLRDNPSLNATADKPGYTVFGKVIQGFDVAQKIAQEPRGQYQGFRDAPNVPVRILEATVIDADARETSAPVQNPQ